MTNSIDSAVPTDSQGRSLSEISSPSERFEFLESYDPKPVLYDKLVSTSDESTLPDRHFEGALRLYRDDFCVIGERAFGSGCEIRYHDQNSITAYPPEGEYVLKIGVGDAIHIYKWDFRGWYRLYPMKPKVEPSFTLAETIYYSAFLIIYWFVIRPFPLLLPLLIGGVLGLAFSLYTKLTEPAEKPTPSLQVQKESEAHKRQIEAEIQERIAEIKDTYEMNRRRYDLPPMTEAKERAIKRHVRETQPMISRERRKEAKTEQPLIVDEKEALEFLKRYGQKREVPGWVEAFRTDRGIIRGQAEDGY